MVNELDYEKERLLIIEKINILQANLEFAAAHVSVTISELHGKLLCLDREYIKSKYEKSEARRLNEDRSELRNLPRKFIGDARAVVLSNSVVIWGLRIGSINCWFARLSTGEHNGPWRSLLEVFSHIKWKWKDHLSSCVSSSCDGFTEDTWSLLSLTKVKLIGDGVGTRNSRVWEVEIWGGSPFIIASEALMVYPNSSFKTYQEAERYVVAMDNVLDGWRPYRTNYPPVSLMSSRSPDVEIRSILA